MFLRYMSVMLYAEFQNLHRLIPVFRQMPQCIPQAVVQNRINGIICNNIPSVFLPITIAKLNIIRFCIKQCLKQMLIIHQQLQIFSGTENIFVGCIAFVCEKHIVGIKHRIKHICILHARKQPRKRHCVFYVYPDTALCPIEFKLIVIPLHSGPVIFINVPDPV